MIKGTDMNSAVIVWGTKQSLTEAFGQLAEKKMFKNPCSRSPR